MSGDAGVDDEGIAMGHGPMEKRWGSYHRGCMGRVCMGEGAGGSEGSGRVRGGWRACMGPWLVLREGQRRRRGQWRGRGAMMWAWARGGRGGVWPVVEGSGTSL